jgi:hypothetical protein
VGVDMAVGLPVIRPTRGGLAAAVERPRMTTPLPNVPHPKRAKPKTKAECQTLAIKYRTEAASLVCTTWLRWNPDFAASYPKFRIAGDEKPEPWRYPPHNPMVAASLFEHAEDYHSAVMCHLWACQYETEAPFPCVCSLIYLASDRCPGRLGTSSNWGKCGTAQGGDAGAAEGRRGSRR